MFSSQSSRLPSKNGKPNQGYRYLIQQQECQEREDRLLGQNILSILLILKAPSAQMPIYILEPVVMVLKMLKNHAVWGINSVPLQASEIVVSIHHVPCSDSSCFAWVLTRQVGERASPSRLSPKGMSKLLTSSRISNLWAVVFWELTPMIMFMRNYVGADLTWWIQSHDTFLWNDENQGISRPNFY